MSEFEPKVSRRSFAANQSIAQEYADNSKYTGMADFCAATAAKGRLMPMM
jgi:hypothetical protein